MKLLKYIIVLMSFFSTYGYSKNHVYIDNHNWEITLIGKEACSQCISGFSHLISIVNKKNNRVEKITVKNATSIINQLRTYRNT